ncbi:flagellar motor switch protein FliM [Desulfallas thermosapovorans]|uniref:Flagellar motor switch protein FliM n=1 Tax=Desulfallas thermosapovorans DSM 6562 TaxID=1121431 RepID=A0A5S4ZTS8_9FIRM|nr:flagellar motor switch protein FliM [Desulfallas thermosapovorans]TYO96284.1 flagellar motor switch protein FliM [Desulfallas thermosapovorans DSM 6562]
MQEVLSQSEIDAMLEALTQGNLPVEEMEAGSVPKVRNYDFRRPNKFSKEHLRTLEMLHQHYARHLSSFLSGYLRSNVNIELASVSQIIFDEFIRSIPTPTVLTVFDLLPLNGSAIMETNNSFIFPVIDMVFGGSGTTGDLNRELTDIEIQVTKKLMARILEYLIPTWHDVYEIKPEVRSIETNPRLQQLYAPNEVVALITLSVIIGENDQGMINICLPYIMLDPVIAKLSVHQQFIRQTPADFAESHKLIAQWLGQCAVDITAVIGETAVTVEDFLQVQVGDVIVLDKNVDSDLDIYVGEDIKFGAQVGSVGDNLAVQIVSLVERKDSDE